MKKYAKKGLALCLAAAMIFSLAACGSQKEGGDDPQQTQRETKEFLWVPTFLTADMGNSSLYNAVIQNDKLYYMDTQWDETTQKSSTELVSVRLSDGSEADRISFAEQEEEENKEEEKTGGSSQNYSSRNYSCFAIDDAGDIITVETVYHWSETTSSREYFLCKYNAQGERLYELDFSDKAGEDSYIRGIALDGENRIYLADDSAIWLFDAEGAYAGKIELQSELYLRAMCADREGRIFFSADGMGSDMKLYAVDFAQKSLGESYDLDIRPNNDQLTLGPEKGFLIYDNNGLYEYDPETQTSEMLLDWIDSDINGNYVNLVSAMEDGRIFVESHDWMTESKEFALLTKTPSAEVAEKVTLVVGSLSSDYEIRNAVVAFNKSNDRYHISMKSYYDSNDVTWSGDTSNYEEVYNDALTRMNNDITSNNCPDLLVLSGVDTAKFAAKGVFEDLGAYLDKSSQLSRSDYFENLLEASTFDGVLVSVPRTFTLQTVAGKASDLGGKTGWTLDEMLAYADEHPGADLFANFTKSRALDIMLSYNLSDFVDWESGKCSFDQEDFVKILEFAARFPDEYVYDEDAPSYPVRIANGEVLLEPCYIYDFQSIQVEDAIFDGDVAFVGYPNGSGNSGTYFQLRAGIAITTKCADKEGAWTFLEHYLSEGVSERFSSGFPGNRKLFAEARAKATEIKYVLDDNGEKILDEDGEPLIEGAGGGIGYGDDWMYTYHVTTDEEADRLEALIRTASPSAGSDTQILKIITEEAQAFFKGQRSAQDVAGVIQSRAQVYVNENM
ncbi:MAG: extracellular solute-binding protein [Muribaculum sp.]|nr:extracellular solute-binding protein [Muribaculum sp.]